MIVIDFCADLWRSATRPLIFRRCATIAAIVGTLLTLVNQSDALLGVRDPDASLPLRIGANYLIPFVVSNLGAMSTRPRRPGPPHLPLPAAAPPLARQRRPSAHEDPPRHTLKLDRH